MSLSRIPSRGVIRAHPREGLSPCLCCPPLLYVWLFFAMHVLNFHTVYIFFCFYCIGCVFSLCFVITILQLCLLGQCSMFFTFCIASSITAFYSLPYQLLAGLLCPHPVHTVAGLSQSLTFHRDLLIGLVVWHSTQFLFLNGLVYFCY